MAEEKLFLNDPNLLSDLNCGMDQPMDQSGFNPASDSLPQDLMLEQLLTGDTGDSSHRDQHNLDCNQHPNEDVPDPNEHVTDNLPEDINMEQATGSQHNEANTSDTQKDTSVEEHHVESPSATAEGYTFKCVYCERTLVASDNPKLMECLHNACTSCINSKLYEHNEHPGQVTQLLCPICNVYSGQSRIIENQFLLDVASNSEENAVKNADIKCSSCSDEAMATSYCNDCSEFICDNCVQAHQRLKITKDHTIKSKDEAMSELNAVSNGTSPNLFCSNHPHEKLSLFCESCDKLTCRDCQLIEHREHKYKFTNEIASEAKKYISDMLKDVGYKRALLTSAMKVIDDRQNLIAEKKHALVKEITQLVVKLTNTINVRGKQLVSKLTEVCDSKQKTLQEKKLALQQLSKMTDHCIDFTQYALETGSDMALLYSKKQVTEHLKRIKCKRADIPNPEIPVRIHLALDKVPDLIKVMSTIGQIVVDGRVYPSQTSSPSLILPGALPPQSSPSPGSMRPPQQQSPMSPLHQQTSPSGFMHQQQPPPPQVQQSQQQQMGVRMPNPPSYVQFQNSQQQYQQQQSSSMMGQVMNQNFGHSNRMQNMGPPGGHSMNQAIPISLAQQLNISRLQRAPLTRALIPRMASSMGMNQQQHQVSSSTHPQGMLQDRSNLRNLLQPNSSNNNAIYIQTGPSQYQAIPGAMAQQFQNRFPGQQQIRFPQQQQQQQQQPQQIQQQQHQQQQQQQQHQHQQHQQQQQNQVRMMIMQGQQGSQARMVMQQHQLQPQQQQRSGSQQFPTSGGMAKWHTPQQHNVPGNSSQKSNNQAMPTINDNFKITLRSQPEQKCTPATVTSTIPTTPSPNHVLGRETEKSLDKFCEESVKDLMATIAKLDSNGVQTSLLYQVLAEGRQKGGSPHVDSSTGNDGPSPQKMIKAELMDTSKDDPNEDWCAVCMDGGELVCCDKCPKVFHQYCHIPNLSVEENDTWQCLLCMNFSDIPDSILSERKEGELSMKERKISERIVLELYCQYDVSLPFRELIPLDNAEYHSIIKQPIALDTIRQKLNWQAENHYRNMADLVKDVNLMFKNAYTFNPVDSQVYTDAKTLEKFFDEQLEKFLPEFAYVENFTEEDADSHPPTKKFRRVVND